MTEFKENLQAMIIANVKEEIKKHNALQTTDSALLYNLQQYLKYNNI